MLKFNIYSVHLVIFQCHEDGIKPKYRQIKKFYEILIIIKISKKKNIQKIENRDLLFKRLTEIKTKIYRAKKSIQFLKNCKTNKTYPAFTFIPTSTLKYVNWSQETIKQKRLEKMNDAINEHLRKSEKHEFININFSNKSNRDLTKLIYKVNNFIENNEKNNNLKRFSKLKKPKI
jgi:hypothetical protein